MNATLEALRAQIKKQLELCDKSDTPTVCSMMEKPEGQDEVVQLVLHKVMYGSDTSIADAIVEVENTYNINSVDQ